MATPDSIPKQVEESMTKSMDHLKKELKSIRTGRASPSIIEFIKVEYYGSTTDLKAIASISVPEPTQLLIKPFDTGSIGDIKRAVESSGLGFNPISDGKSLRINIPALTGDRRKQLVALCKKNAEEAKVTFRNARRDGNKHADGLKGSGIPEDELETLKKEIQDLLKKFETDSDALVTAKQKEIETL
jgi:ribosome recycling factor